MPENPYWALKWVESRVLSSSQEDTRAAIRGQPIKDEKMLQGSLIRLQYGRKNSYLSSPIQERSGE